MNISFSNHLLNIHSNDFYQNGNKNLFIRLMKKQNLSNFENFS